MFGPILLIYFCYVATTASVRLGPCKKGDDECFMKSYNDAHPIVYSGIPSMGIESLDPMFQELIEGDLIILNYKLTNSTVKGFKDCRSKNVHLDLNTLKLSYIFDCPTVSMSGTYEISGKLLTMPVEGKGPYELVSSAYTTLIEADLISMKGDDGKTYMQILNFKIKPEALGPIKFDFKNLFNDQKDLADALLKFAHENWKEVSKFTQGPIFRQNLKKIYKHYNKFLKTQALEDVFPN